jgi:thiol-disulfide isomerase/thioredoxin
VVEVEIPESELTSGYKAEGAKDAVGNVDWHSGVVNGQLPADRQRQVTLSRYSKVNRVVPDSEVADMIAKQLDGTNIEVPYNVVTPSLRAELEKKIAENASKGGYRVMAIEPELSGDDIFKAIVAPYKGQPVLVDFWATWCGPCRRAMETIKPVKEQLAGKCAFVYVSGPTSPEGLWKNMIADIHGDHYYVTDDQYSTLLNQFESQSIPTYVTVDSNGNIVNHYIGYPGNDVIKADLSK